jgi:hypothetical protein
MFGYIPSTSSNCSVSFSDHPDDVVVYVDPSYSYLNATSGSTFVARRAGIKLAPSATRNKRTGTATKVTRSVGVTPNNKLDMTRVAA